MPGDALPIGSKVRLIITRELSTQSLREFEEELHRDRRPLDSLGIHDISYLIRTIPKLFRHEHGNFRIGTVITLIRLIRPQGELENLQHGPVPQSQQRREVNLMIEVGTLLGELSNTNAAFDLLQGALWNAAGLGYTEKTAEAWWQMSRIHYRLEGYQKAITACQATIDLSREADNAILETNGQRGMGMAKIRLGDLTGAKDHLMAGFRVARDHDLVEGQGLILDSLGIIASKQGEFGEARRRFHEAIPFLEKANDDRLIAKVYENLGRVHLKDDDPQEAQACFDRALEAAERIKDDKWVGRILLSRAKALAANEDAVGCLAACDQARGHLENVGNKRDLAGLWRTIAFGRALQGDQESAEQALAEAEGLIGTDAAPAHRARLLYDWGRVEQRLGNGAAARERLEAARELFDELGDPTYLARIEGLMNGLD